MADVTKRIETNELIVAGDLCAPEAARDRIGAQLENLAAVCRGRPLVVNLESALWPDARRNAPPAGVFSSPTLLLDTLRRLNVCAASLANNHTSDAGDTGFAELVAHLRGELGLSLIEDAAGRVTTARVQLASGAVVTFACAAWNGTGARGCRVERFWRPDALLRRVRRERDECDFLLAFLHWGYEFEAYPLPAQRAWARALIDAGADGVIGAHAHVPQGFEVYEGKLIAYSVGNLFFPRTPRTAYHPASTRTGLLVRLRFGTNGRYEFAFEGISGADLSEPVRAIDPGPLVAERSTPLTQDAEDYRRFYRAQRPRWYLPSFEDRSSDRLRVLGWLAVDRGNRWSERLRVKRLVRALVRSARR